MAVHIKSGREILGMRVAGSIAAGALDDIRSAVQAGITLNELEDICVDRIKSEGAVPTFQGYQGFPAAVCISVNEEVVHGIPDNRRLELGDIVKVDVGVTKDGLIADAARTYEVGPVKPEVHDLVGVTEESFRRGMDMARPGRRVSDIGAAVQDYVEEHGYSVVRALCGHGVGVELHEEPSIPNFGRPGKGMELKAGMTLAIEPMVNMGRFEVETLDNGWTVVAKDRLPSAHYENTILVTDKEPDILTRHG